jgi:hypothetical protein
VAFTVTVWELPIEAGAVYRPAEEIVPTAGLSDHVTALLEVPPTVAVYCWVWATARVAESGVNEMLTGGLSVTVALADLVGSAALVAVTVTVCGPLSAAGAEYRPLLEIVPTAGITDHVTAVFVVPVTAAVNC